MCFITETKKRQVKFQIPRLKKRLLKTIQLWNHQTKQEATYVHDSQSKSWNAKRIRWTKQNALLHKLLITRQQKEIL